MVFRSTGIVELGSDLSLTPAQQDTVPITIPSVIPADGIILLDSVEVGSGISDSDAQSPSPEVENLDYSTYEPFPGVVSITYTGDEITNIITTNEHGTKTADFTYVNGEVVQVDVNNYGLAIRQVTFVRTGDYITQINIVNN